jgi:hypothetical protein
VIVTVLLPNGTDELHNITSFEPLPGALKLRQAIAEEKSSTGLIARVGGRSKFLIYPWSRVLKVEVEE